MDGFDRLSVETTVNQPHRHDSKWLISLNWSIGTSYRRVSPYLPPSLCCCLQCWKASSDRSKLTYVDTWFSKLMTPAQPPIHPTEPIAHGSLNVFETLNPFKLRSFNLVKLYPFAIIQHYSFILFPYPLRSRPQRLQRPVKVARASCPRERGCKIVKAVLASSEVADQVQQNTVFFSTWIMDPIKWTLGVFEQDMGFEPQNRTLKLPFTKIH